MMANVTIDFRGFLELKKRISELDAPVMEEVKKRSVKELASVYLASAKKILRRNINRVLSRYST